ncbi:multidrug MFS transporter [Oleiphilus sp. HI0071]|nr:MULTISPECIES: sugar transferase [unclassified Oleiphilus]KZY64002.1 multidrug MFS transporter [Oleiphilus sp. HI0065]KZY80369.1 multidrug MFS transporter [Oleiphilus sp. HI0071]KZZ05856.1 multidrug MFS transporter [Oleiphilus sp. HI0073]KZZ40163.1 multidrug MFS transporter [Oleiphilus sp. HI0118]KZZ51931.1 multidrug MFS transporter [Oleiphilus sp. HI0122]KZZ76207.1 multidrug MFS transporter [Oleiphilus sp. HI0130]KZZ76305.1 multidrug MFS transporter [Oleiphilus sp. HI0133]
MKSIQSKHLGLSPLLQRAIALVGLILISPVLLITALLIRLESPGSPIFTQTRVGLHGRRFAFYKFRSMRVASDPKYVDVSTIKSDRDGVCKKLFNDPRVTRIGKIIRKYSIDELPQLINVVKGDMLLIGPRPALVQETDIYSMTARQRLQILPGLTGLWQVSGRADTTFEEQVSLDIRYIKEQSWMKDIKILLSTVPVVLFGRGAY